MLPGFQAGLTESLDLIIHFKLSKCKFRQAYQLSYSIPGYTPHTQKSQFLFFSIKQLQDLNNLGSV